MRRRRSRRKRSRRRMEGRGRRRGRREAPELPFLVTNCHVCTFPPQQAWSSFKKDQTNKNFKAAGLAGPIQIHLDSFLDSCQSSSHFNTWLVYIFNLSK